LRDHVINTITYGERIDTDVNTMVEGMMELFDDLCDLALSRIYNKTQGTTRGFDFDALYPNEISRFKITWVICLSELMFFSMGDQPKLKHLKKNFYEKMNYEARERSLQTFISQALIRIPVVIKEDRDFVENEIFSAPASNRLNDEPRNRGLGPRLAQLILENAFGQNQSLKPVYKEIQKVVELEFNNAYGHSSIACSKFNII